MGALLAGGVATITSAVNTTQILALFYMNSRNDNRIRTIKLNSQHPSSYFSSGLRKSSQVADSFAAASPDVVVREAKLEDCWAVADTHCSTFFSKYSFPWNFMLRLNRAIGLLFGFSVHSGRHRTCLVASISYSNQQFEPGSLGGRLSPSDDGLVVGILTLDTLADFLPRRGPLQLRRTGIAYISNVAVRERYRRRGIATLLTAGAECKARSWHCRALALHCDINDAGVTKLYRGQGFKRIRVPDGANWPQPKTSPHVHFDFMMKLL